MLALYGIPILVVCILVGWGLAYWADRRRKTGGFAERDSDQ